MGFTRLSQRRQEAGQGQGLWQRWEMQAVSGLAPKNPDPAQMARLGCVAPAQKLTQSS